MARPVLTADDVPDRLLGRTKVERLERENRAFRARIRDLEEDYAGPADIEGAANLPSIGTLRDKNVPLLFRHIDALPVIAGEDGFDAAIRYAQSALLLHVEALWLRPSRNPVQERHRHDVLREFFEEPGVSYLVEPGRRGRFLRRLLERTVLRLSVRGSIELMGERGREAPMIPLKAPRPSPES